jgi:SAM-dependent methyltransferase
MARSSIARRLMESTAVPAIYTRYWRPALGWFAKGLGGPSMAEEFALADEFLALQPGDVVLDVGCGPGNFTRRFAAAVAPDGLAVGLDASTSMLRQAAKEGRDDRSAYLRADAVRPPIRARSVDAVCCFAALHMFDRPEEALRSFADLLRPGGRLALLTSARRPGPIGQADAVLGRISGMRMFARDEVVALLPALGFADVQQRVSGVAQFVAARRTAPAGIDSD